MRQIMMILLLGLSVTAHAQIYKYTDASGKVVFSNQPPSHGQVETVELPPTNTIETISPEQKADATREALSPDNAPAYSTLKLDLSEQQAIRANSGDFTVNVISQPPLLPGHQLQAIVDGQPHGVPVMEAQLQFNNLDRGEHSLSVQVLSGDQLVQSSDPVSITVQRVNLGSPARPKPQPPKPPVN